MSGAIVELCAREVARRSLAYQLTGRTPGVLALVVVTAVTAIALAGDRARARAPAHRRWCSPGSSRSGSPSSCSSARGSRATASTTSRICDRWRSIATSISRTTTRCSASATSRTCSSPRQPATRSPRASIGPAILWSPFFAAGHVVGAPARRDRSRRRRQRHLVSVPSGRLRRRTVLRPARLLVLLPPDRAFLRRTRWRRWRRPSPSCGSFMLWYLVKEPSMTHGPSMAAVAGFVWAWIATRDGRTTRQWALARRDRRLHDAHPLAERALRAAAGVRRDRRAAWPPRGRSDRPRVDARADRRRDLHALCDAGVRPADDRLARDLRLVARRVAGRAADSLDRSAARRHPVVVAQRASSAGRRSCMWAPSASSCSPSRGRPSGFRCSSRWP